MSSLPSKNQPLPLLSIFNRYLELGGEEIAVEKINAALAQRPEWFDAQTLFFQSAEWRKDPMPPEWKQAIWMLRNPHSLLRLREAQASTQARCWLVHNVFPVGSAAIYREALTLRIPVIQYIHNFRPFSVSGYLWAGEALATQGLKGRFWREIAAAAWQHSRIKTASFALVLKTMRRLGWWDSVHVWVAVSDFMRERFIEAGVAPQTIFTLRHFHLPRPLPHAVAPGERYFLFLGRMITAKGIKVVLEAWRQLEERFGSNIPELRLAGDGPLSSWVAAEAARYRKVRYLGRISGEEKEAQLNGCIAVVVPSLWWEPLGLVVYEAFDFCKPVLAAASGGLSELIIDSQTGRLHTPGNAAELAEQVMALDADPAGAAEMGRRGRGWLEANTRLDQWLEAFRAITTFATDPAAIKPDAPLLRNLQ
ncbi:MAG: glycosyltransferase family 4 protein [Verrucomicrobiota bacterium]